MSAQIIDKRLSELRCEFAGVLLKLQDLTKARKLEKESMILQEVFSMMNSPYQFVVVGEVKAGKSSFINALLDEQVCKVDAKPCTDTIQEIVFGEQEQTEIRGKYLTRVSRPISLLKTLAIVDTPGTNTVIDNHQIITESYIPHSDLIIFVFPAKNPHTKTAWDLLSFVKDEWKRKVIFVLQQADLEPELHVQVESVRTYALQHRVADPLVFSTSAKLELAGDQGSSGFEAVRIFIRTKVTGGRHLYEKLDGQIGTASSIVDKIEKTLTEDRCQLERDKELQRRIQKKLECGSGRSTKEIDALVDRLVTKYDSISAEFKREFRDGLTMSSVFKKILPGSESAKQWLDGLQTRFNEKLAAKLDDIAKQESEFFIENVKRLMADILHDLESVAKPTDAFDTAERIDDSRSEIIDSVKAKLGQLSNNVASLMETVTGPAGDLSKTVAGGAALTAIGTIIAAAVHVIFIDITGGLLTAIGLTIAGIALLWKRGKIIEQFESGLDRGREEFHKELKEKLSVDLRAVYCEIEKVFQTFFDYLQFREQELIPQIDALAQAKAELLRLATEARNAES